MNRRQKSYERRKYSRGKFCIPCLVRRGKHTPVTNISKMWCCVVCAKRVHWWHKKHPAESDATRLQDGPREMQLGREFWLLVDEVMTTGRMPVGY